MKDSYFLKPRNMYWSEEHEDLVNFLTSGRNASDAAGERREARIFEFNVHVIVFAAVVGLLEGRRKEMSGGRKEVSTAIFENHSVDGYIFLVALLSGKDVDLDLFRDEAGEERAIRLFEEYANGGLSYLMERMTVSLHHEPEQFLLSILKERGVEFNASAQPSEKAIKLFS